MNENPMTEQVNRLIGNRLAAGCELFLPGVGSLFTEQRGARRVSKREVEPPCRAVRFTPQERGTSLVDEIAGAARCDRERAQSIYDRWLDHVLGENTLTIRGVGELRFRNFIPEEEFDLILNPQGHAPVKVKSGGSDWVLWVCLLVFFAALAVGYAMFFQPSLLQRWWNNDEEEVYEQPEAPAAAALPMQPESSAPGSGAAETAAAPNPAASGDRNAAVPAARTDYAGYNGTPAANAPIGTAQAPATLVPGRHYVVVGVFIEPENAAYMAGQIMREDPTLRCGIYRFGGKLMVSPFGSDDPAACPRFIGAHRAQWPDAWTYTAR
ncbi:MAG: hypothetical protein K2I85_01695 [Alistipes sp.]|nr:hypothetical protein [Alistipes sp.]